MSDEIINELGKRRVTITTAAAMGQGGGFNYAIWDRAGNKISQGWSAGKRSDALDSARLEIRERGWIEML